MNLYIFIFKADDQLYVCKLLIHTCNYIPNSHLFLMLKCLVFARKLLHYNLISDTLNTNCTGNFSFYLNNILTWYVYFYSSRIFRNLLQYWSQLLLHFTLNNCQEMFELIKSATFIKIYSEMYLSCFYTFMFDANNHLERFPTKPHGKINCWHLMILPNETEPGFFSRTLSSGFVCLNLTRT